MTKLIVIPTTLKQIYDLNSLCDGFILGIKNLSINMPSYFELDELKEVIKFLKDNNKEVFICLNKNLHNKDLIEVEKCLLELNNLNINGVFYYRSTGSDGIAHLNINLMPGEYIITSSYNGANIANKITIH